MAKQRSHEKALRETYEAFAAYMDTHGRLQSIRELVVCLDKSRAEVQVLRCLWDLTPAMRELFFANRLPMPLVGFIRRGSTQAQQGLVRYLNEEWEELRHDIPADYFDADEGPRAQGPAVALLPAGPQSPEPIAIAAPGRDVVNAPAVKASAAPVPDLAGTLNELKSALARVPVGQRNGAVAMLINVLDDWPGAGYGLLAQMMPDPVGAPESIKELGREWERRWWEGTCVKQVMGIEGGDVEASTVAMQALVSEDDVTAAAVAVGGALTESLAEMLANRPNPAAGLALTLRLLPLYTQLGRIMNWVMGTSTGLDDIDPPALVSTLRPAGAYVDLIEMVWAGSGRTMTGEILDAFTDFRNTVAQHLRNYPIEPGPSQEPGATVATCPTPNALVGATPNA